MTTMTRRISDAEYLARYEAQVREYVDEWTGETELRHRWHCHLSFGVVGSYKDDAVALSQRIREYRWRLRQLTGSSTLYALDAEGQRVEWRADG